jgi:hypothetical protein
MLRRILGVAIGMVAAFLVIIIAQIIMTQVIAPPSPETMRDPALLRKWVEAMPASANILLILGYVAGSFVGGFVASKAAGKNNGFLPALLVGIALLGAGAVNFFITMPGSPVWAIALSLICYVPLAMLGHKTAN